ncbi:hypothetical protein Tco_1146423 [Tanacetum coccineum]
MIGIEVASTGRNNGPGADLEFTREIEFEKDVVLKDLKSLVGSVVEEDSSGVKNSLINDDYGWGIGRSFEFLHQSFDLGCFDKKLLDERLFDIRYSDTDYAGCNMDRKSTSGACQIHRGKLVRWSAKKQKSVAMSSTEVEYVAAAGCYTSIL